MESYQVLETAIPRDTSSRVAQLLNVSADYVRRWRREPESDESPNGTGQRSILDRVCDLIDAVFLVNPKGPALIVNYIDAHYRGLMQTHAKPIDCHSSRADVVEELLVETTQAVNRLNREGSTAETLRELVELRDAANKAIIRCESTMAAEEKANYA